MLSVLQIILCVGNPEVNEGQALPLRLSKLSAIPLFGRLQSSPLHCRGPGGRGRPQDPLSWRLSIRRNPRPHVIPPLQDDCLQSSERFGGDRAWRQARSQRSCSHAPGQKAGLGWSTDHGNTKRTIYNPCDLERQMFLSLSFPIHKVMIMVPIIQMPKQLDRTKSDRTYNTGQWWIPQ